MTDQVLIIGKGELVASCIGVVLSLFYRFLVRPKEMRKKAESKAKLIVEFTPRASTGPTFEKS